MRLVWPFSFALPFALALALPLSSFAAVLHVPADHPTIAAAIAAAADGDEIVLACGTYSEYDIRLDKPLTLRSETGDPDCVTVDAGWMGRGFEISCWDESVLLEGITITHAHPPGSIYEETGGAVYSGGADLTVRRCRFIANDGERPEYYGGAAIYENQGTLIVEDCEFTENLGATLYYVEYASGSDSLVVTGSRFVDNTEGADFVVKTARLTDCLFLGNGGPVRVRASDGALIERCRFEQNVGYWGGALDGHGPGIRVEHCEFVNNSATTSGGALYFWHNVPGAEAVIENSTFEGSSAPVGAIGMVDAMHAVVRCCFTDPLEWATDRGGTIEFDDEDCAVAIESTPWGKIKALYR